MGGLKELRLEKFGLGTAQLTARRRLEVSGVGLHEADGIELRVFSGAESAEHGGGLAR